MSRGIKHEEEVFRQYLRHKSNSQFREVQERNRRDGRYPFEGRWRMMEEIIAMQEELKRKDREIFLELNILFIGMLLMIAVISFILYKLL
jgi:hypothetical protein